MKAFPNCRDDEIKNILVIRSSPFGHVNKIMDRFRTRYPEGLFTMLVQEICRDQSLAENNILYREKTFTWRGMSKVKKNLKSYDLLVLPVNNSEGKNYFLLALFLLIMVKARYKLAVTVEDRELSVSDLIWHMIAPKLIYIKNVIIGFFVQIGIWMVIMILKIKIFRTVSKK